MVAYVTWELVVIDLVSLFVEISDINIGCTASLIPQLTETKGKGNQL